jgi:hypothetical protein
MCRVALAARYGYKGADTEVDGLISAIVFGLIALCACLFDAAAVRASRSRASRTAAQQIECRSFSSSQDRGAAFQRASSSRTTCRFVGSYCCTRSGCGWLVRQLKPPRDHLRFGRAPA